MENSVLKIECENARNTGGRKRKWDVSPRDMDEIRDYVRNGLTKTRISRVMRIPRTTLNDIIERSGEKIHAKPGRPDIRLSSSAYDLVAEGLSINIPAQKIAVVIGVKYGTLIDKIKTDPLLSSYDLQIGRREIVLSKDKIEAIEKCVYLGLPIRFVAMKIGTSYEWLRSRLEFNELDQHNEVNAAYVRGFIKRREKIGNYCKKVFESFMKDEIPFTQSVLDLYLWWDLVINDFGKMGKNKRRELEMRCWNMALIPLASSKSLRRKK